MSTNTQKNKSALIAFTGGTDFFIKYYVILIPVAMKKWLQLP